jgi:glucose-1-phosphate adenylyltransferase
MRNCIVWREAVVEKGAVREDCIIMDYVRVGRGARLWWTVVDRHNLIAERRCIGFDSDADRERFTVSSSGVVVVPRGQSPFYPRRSRSLYARYAE